MGEIRDPVKLQDDNLAVMRAGHHLLEVLRRPVRIGVAGGRNQQRMVARGVVRRADLHLTVRYLGLHSAPRELVSMLFQNADGLRAKVVAGPGEADGARHTHFGQRPLDQGQLTGQMRRAVGF